MDDKRYTLMNKNRPVLDFLYNLDTHHVVNELHGRRRPEQEVDYLKRRAYAREERNWIREPRGL